MKTLLALLTLLVPFPVSGQGWEKIEGSDSIVSYRLRGQVVGPHRVQHYPSDAAWIDGYPNIAGYLRIGCHDPEPTVEVAIHDGPPAITADTGAATVSPHPDWGTPIPIVWEEARLTRLQRVAVASLGELYDDLLDAYETDPYSFLWVAIQVTLHGNPTLIHFRLSTWGVSETIAGCGENTNQRFRQTTAQDYAPPDTIREPHRMNLYFDQDMFLNTDQNYTMGAGIQLTGSWLKWKCNPHYLIDQLLPILPNYLIGQLFPSHPKIRLTPQYSSEKSFHSLMLLGSAFTPKTLTSAEPVEGDRPYASLLNLVSSRLWAFADDSYAIATELGLGFLGLSVSERIQTEIHRRRSNSPEPLGWRNQISDGGEFTGFYRIGVRKLLADWKQKETMRFDATADGEIWLGYYTNVSIGKTFRLARISHTGQSEA